LGQGNPSRPFIESGCPQAIAITEGKIMPAYYAAARGLARRGDGCVQNSIGYLKMGLAGSASLAVLLIATPALADAINQLNITGCGTWTAKQEHGQQKTFGPSQNLTVQGLGDIDVTLNTTSCQGATGAMWLARDLSGVCSS
jgi:hypothetical protein